MRRALGWVLLGVMTTACDKGGGSASAACPDADSGETGTAEVAPIAIDCSLAYGQAPVEVVSALPRGGGGVADGGLVTRQLGGIRFELLLSDDQYDVRSLTVRAVDAQDQLLVSTVFQMDRSRLPANEFYGQHGFTGLVSVRDHPAGETLQYACFARDPSEPVMQWED